MSDSDVSMPAKRPGRSARRQRHAVADDSVRILRLVQRLLLRDMRRQKLSLRRAARDGGVSVGTLFFVLDGDRVNDPGKHPKRRLRRSTLLLLRNMPWIQKLTAATLDQILSSTRRQATRHDLANGTSRRS